MWLWHRLAATALIQPLAQELPYATGVATRKEERKRKKKKNLLISTLLIQPESTGQPSAITTAARVTTQNLKCRVCNKIRTYPGTLRVV